MHKASNKVLTSLVLLRQYCICLAFCPGIICHEFWHYIIARLFRVQIKTFKPFILHKGNIFNEKKYSPVRGKVSYTTQSILNMSSLTAFCISIAPIISAITIFFIYQYNILFVREYIEFYLVLVTPILLASFPSTGDFQFYNFHLRKNHADNFLAKISWILFGLCTVFGRFLDKISQHIIVLLGLIVIMAITIPIKINEVSIANTFIAYIYIQWLLKFILEKLKIKSDFVILPINEFYAQTFPHCRLLLLLQTIFVSLTRGDDIVPRTLDLDLKLSHDSLETFISKFPQAKEVQSNLQSCRIFHTDLKLHLLPSKSGYFTFNKMNGNLEQISIYFVEHHKFSTLNIIWKKCLNITKPYLLCLKELIFHDQVPYKEVKSIFCPIAGNYLEMYYKNNQELVVSYSTFWYRNLLPLIEPSILDSHFRKK